MEGGGEGLTSGCLLFRLEEIVFGAVSLLFLWLAVMPEEEPL